MKGKPLPKLESDAEAEEFVATADLTQYDLSGLVPLRLELERKEKSVSLRLPEDLFNALRAQAEKENMPYESFIRLALERAVGHG
jgi:predicted DNA binding CopG/RHH family protein